MAKKQFKAESRRLLDLMINSIYTHKEIFLREIISNASDAIDKLCYASLTDDSIGMNREDFRIRITVDKQAGTLTVSDNGIGMTAEEMEQNLGVIAKSGTMQFRDSMDAKTAEQDNVSVIGQFGVGFYSAFMVSDKVTVISRAWGQEEGSCWESAGVDGYTITPCRKDTVGTDVIMHIKTGDGEDSCARYLESWQLTQLIRKYSDYIRWPIIMDVEHTEYRDTDEKDEDGNPKQEACTVTKEETINTMTPIWQRSKSEVSDEECIAFYKEKYHETEDPLAVIRVNAEGQVAYRALLFIPAKAPGDYFTVNFKKKIQLYSNGVMIMDNCEDLLPDCFAFVRGVVDSSDLSLNISREMLQHDRQLRIIANSIERRVKNELLKMLTNDREKYCTFFDNFGQRLKAGVISSFGEKRELVLDLLLYRNAENKYVTIADYTAAMPAEQPYIYYACAPTVEKMLQMPKAGFIRGKGYDLLCASEEFDELVFLSMSEFMEKKFCNISKSDLGFGEDEKKESEAGIEAHKNVVEFVQKQLEGRVKTVRLTDELGDYPACLTSEGQFTIEMERRLRRTGMGVENMAERVLELNTESHAFQALCQAVESNPERAHDLVELLHTQALMLAGEPVPDPLAFSQQICRLF